MYREITTEIYVNNQVLRPKVKPVTYAEILRLTDEEYTTAKSTKLVDGNEHIEAGSEFYSFAPKTKSVQDIVWGYRKMRIKFADATHISCAYRLSDPSGPYDQGYVDDGE